MKNWIMIPSRMNLPGVKFMTITDDLHAEDGSA